MKLFVLLLCMLLGVYSAGAQQCIVSGMVRDTAVKTITLSLLYADGEYAVHTQTIAIATGGKFKTAVQLPHPLFAVVKAGNVQQRLLLSAGRDVQLLVDTTLAAPVQCSGKGAVENTFIGKSILNNTAFFLQAKWQEDKKMYDEAVPYTKVTVAGWPQLILAPVQHDIDSVQQRIRQSAIPAAIQQLLISEVNYAYQLALIDFAANNLRFANNSSRDSLLDRALQWQPMPDSATLVNGYYANRVLGRRCYTVMFRKSRSFKTAREEQFAAYLHTTTATIDSLKAKYNEGGIYNWFYCLNYLPVSLQDKMVFNELVYETEFNSPATAAFLLRGMEQHYPNSRYLSIAKSTLQQCLNKKQQAAANGSIRFYGSNNISSLHDLVKPYAGKVVFLDIWGTWCGPCKKEMAYVPALRQRYKGKAVVFLYLDMDPEQHESKWKEYVLVEGLEGEHYRMDSKNIGVIWDDLQQAGATALRTYPTYVIIDRKGNIVNVKAEGPGSKEKLYDQLDKTLQL